MITTSPLFRHAVESQRSNITAQMEHDVYAWRHYTGEYAFPEWINLYLYRQWQRESPKMYAERALWADPALHFATVVDELIGQIMNNEKEIQRQWSEAGTLNVLGDADESGSVAYNITRDSDGFGTNWETLQNRVGVQMTVLRKAWIYVDGVKMDGANKIGEATVHTIFPWNVLGSIYDDNKRLTEVVVKTQKEKRKSLKEASEVVDQYIRFTLDGWELYSGESLDTMIDSGEYAFYRTADRTDRILPIFPVMLPLEREVGYMLARKLNSIFNTESVRDWSMRNGAFNFLRIVGEDKEFEAIVKQLEKGTNILQQSPSANKEHSFIEPDTTVIDSLSKVLQEKISIFYSMAFREYADAAKLQTATEIIQKSQSSLNAFLTLLTGAMDEAENGMFWRLTQIYNPDNPQVWGDSYVERSTDFVHTDPDGIINNLVARYIGQGATIPVTDSLMEQALNIIFRNENMRPDQMDMKEVVRMAQAKAGNMSGNTDTSE